MDKITIFEMGPRDGLQNEPTLINAADKITLVDMLSNVGFRKIEVTSFVSPKWVPQMADAHEVLTGISRREGVSYTALTPNKRGFDDALAGKADEVAIFGSASEGFSKANINCTIEESFDRFVPIIQAARENDIPVRGYVSCVTDCPYDGATDPTQVAYVAGRLMQMGCYEVSLGDTIGAGRPETVSNMLKAVLNEVSAEHLAGHFHDTHGQALENIEVSLDYGVRVFDAAVGGLGGCPYAPGAKGNVATESVNDLLLSMGYDTGLNVALLEQAAKFAKGMRSGA